MLFLKVSTLISGIKLHMLSKKKYQKIIPEQKNRVQLMIQ